MITLKYARLIIAALAVLVCFAIFFPQGARAQCQSYTTVTGTVTDPSGIPYAGATLYVDISPSSSTSPSCTSISGGQQVLTPSQLHYSLTLDPTGSFSLQVPPNAIISPASTSWVFTVNLNSPGPIGTGILTFTYSATISGSSQSLSAALSAAAPSLSHVSATPTGAAGGALSGTYPNPTAGTPIAPNQNITYLSTNCGAQANCTTAKWDVGTSADSTTTSGSNIVTCPECKFQTGVVGTVTPPAVAGQIFFANDSTSALPGANTCLDNVVITFGGSNQTTVLSVDSDTQLHVTGNSNTTSTGKACIAWGDDDTTAINAAWTAGGCGASADLPIGIAFFQSPIFQIIAGCTAATSAGTGYQGQSVNGHNFGRTILMPTPNFNFTSVAGSGAGSCTTACKSAVGNPNVSDWENLEVWGLGEPCAAAEANTILWAAGTGSRMINTAGVGWCGRGGGTSLIGIQIPGYTDKYDVSGSNFFGSFEISFNAGNIYFGDSFINGNPSAVPSVGNCGVVLQSNSSVVSKANYISVCIGLQSGAVLNSEGMTLTGNAYGTADSACLFIGGSAVVNLLSNDSVCQQPGTNEESTDFFSTGGIIRMSNSNHFANGTAACIAGAASNIIEDNNDNSFTCGSGGIWNGLGNWMGSGSAHSKPLVTGNLVLSSGWGTTRATSAWLGGDFPNSFTITNGGTGQGASPTIAYTFPYALAQAPISCTATQIGGTNATGTFTSSSLTKTGVTFTYSLTPTASDTEIVTVNCVTY